MRAATFSATTYTARGQLGRDALLRQYVPLVQRLAHHMIAKLPPNVEVDDLIQVGMIGLAEALSRYEPSQGVQFETFATQRIRGAMLDELREGDWLSRGSRKSQKDIERAVHWPTTRGCWGGCAARSSYIWRTWAAARPTTTASWSAMPARPTRSPIP
jgi:RNA polymerase sigma factor (sigma-70 family)